MASKYFIEIETVDGPVGIVTAEIKVVSLNGLEVLVQVGEKLADLSLMFPNYETAKAAYAKIAKAVGEVA